MRTSMLREIPIGCRHTKSLDRINDIENKIGAGLVEEVIMVADGELTLVDEMIAARVYALSPCISYGFSADISSDGNPLKKRLLQGNGTISNEAVTLGQPRCWEATAHKSVHIRL